MDSIRECSVAGCDRPYRVKGYCHAHYRRMQRKGSLDLDPPPPPKRECAVDECAELEDGRCGLCKRHDARRRRHGDPTKFVDVSERAFARGADSPHWSGEQASYQAAHQRVHRVRGSASDFQCACGEPARHWAYDHSDPDEKRERVRSTLAPYSLRVEHYKAMCALCHKRMDNARHKR